MDLIKTESTQFTKKGKKAISFYCPFCKRNTIGLFHSSEVYRHDDCPNSKVSVFFLNGHVLTGIVEYNTQQRGEKKDEPKKR